MDRPKPFNGLDIKLEATEMHDQLPYPELDIQNEMFGQNGLFQMAGGDDPTAAKQLQLVNGVSVDDDDDEEDDEDVIILHMDIRQPIRQLRTMLEQRIGVNLSGYEYWLQDAQMLEAHKNLVDQCVKGEGLVQINAQVRTNTKRINIVDVLKPMDDAVVDLDDETSQDDVRSGSESPAAVDEATVAAAAAIERELSASGPNSTDTAADHKRPAKAMRSESPPCIDIDEEDDSNLETPQPLKPQWIIDTQFKKEQTRLHISEDPRDWTQPQVKHWLQWAVRQFNLTNIKLQDWSITGKELHDMTLEEFHQKVPHDPDNVFLTHVELLRRLKVAAIPGDISDHDGYNENMQPMKPNRTIIGGRPMLMKQPTIKMIGPIANYGIEAAHQGNRTGNNGQIQLWQFLLEMLTEREHREIISWIGGQGEFKLTDPERVAQLWGERKNKPTMNYEKLSRALRYYYDGDMISKVHGKRFVYKFVCDLTQLIGYNAQQLANLVNQPMNDTDLINSMKDFMED